MFDALWGGPDGMYAARLGARWRASNPLLDLEMAGVRLAFGSDSPVTPLGPWAAIRAAAYHHNERQRLPVGLGFRAHTRGGALAGHDEDGGLLAPGRRADLAVWEVADSGTDARLPDLTPGTDLPRLLRTVAAGRTIHTTEDAA
jgi:predicted amidohydrolase YtcJ